MEWKQTIEGNHSHLEKTFVFNDFSEAFGFITRVALLSEKSRHHPEWSQAWNRVNIKLSTHDAGNVITDKDHRLAQAIDAIAGD
jgi:4a-hydroxytetrahydrobiopterin dehydratase